MDAAIAYGSNLGDREANLGLAERALERAEGVEIVARSRLRETEPVGGPPQGRFLNGVWLVRTTLEPVELLRVLATIESATGRVRAIRNGPRTLDLDLLFHGDTVLTSAGLTLPHPRLHERHFVLEPLADVAPTWRHPLLGRTVLELLAECDGSPSPPRVNEARA